MNTFKNTDHVVIMENELNAMKRIMETVILCAEKGQFIKAEVAFAQKTYDRIMNLTKSDDNE